MSDDARGDLSPDPSEPAAPERGNGQGADTDDGARRGYTVVAPDGSEVPSQDDAGQDRTSEERDPGAAVEEPAKVMRIGGMIKRLLEEVRDSPLDEAARSRLAEIHERSLKELEEGLSPELVAELHRISLPFSDDAVPSDAELRVAQAQLVGWLEGLFHGIQTALVAQQMAAQAQLSQIRRALPPGALPVPGMPGQPGHPAQREGDDARPSPGQYL
ncbi:bacterial proteasome activator family protein [Oerskovia sp. NPDC057915]|uniref:bacterial proteasome activator family protein n=1 Tax=Oerskovia sp. NPDC057915 TaxID=3346280 RepID=UPI0036DCC330